MSQATMGEPLRVGIGRPTSPYRGGKERITNLFPLKGGMSALLTRGVLYECVQKIHSPSVDRPVENGYNEDARGAAGRRLTPIGLQE